MRSISRVVDVSINTVTKLLVDAGTACATFHDEHVRQVPSKRVQVDEIWSFTYAKQKNVDKALLRGNGRRSKAPLEAPNVQLRLILWPARPYRPEFMFVRYDNLLAWMRTARDMPNVKFRCGKFRGYNRLIVSDRFVLEGHKAKAIPGYDMSAIRYQPGVIADAIKSFQSNWAQCDGEEEEAIAQVARMRTSLHNSVT